MVDNHLQTPGYITYIIYGIGQYDHLYREMIEICQPVESSLYCFANLFHISGCITLMAMLDFEDFYIKVVTYLEFSVFISLDQPKTDIPIRLIFLN